MTINYKLPLFAFLISLIIISCNSSEQKKEVRTLKDDKKDSLLLVYNPDKADQRIDDYFKKLNKTRGFNGNVLVAKNGKIIYEKSFGYADYLHRDSLKINSVFQLASVSKPITATAIMLLIEEGRLKLTQQVKDFYPDFPYDGITIKMLLTHRSGLTNYVYFTDKIWKKKYKGMTNDDVMRLFAEHKPAPYARPDQVFHYNNTNYMILGGIIEKASGKPIAQFLQEKIFQPCGMKNTKVYSTAVYEKIPVDVVGHDRIWRRSVRQDFLDGPVGDKGIYSTVQDLYLFDQALRDGRLLKKKTLKEAYTAMSKLEKGHFGYGYGWRTFEIANPNEKVVYHTGWWHGFRHIFLRDTKRNITIVVLSNLFNGSINQIDELYSLVGMPVVRRGAYVD